MHSKKHVVKVVMVWTSIVYAVCYFGVMLFGGIRPGFMRYALHMNYPADVFQNVFTVGTFVSGLVIWNIIVLLLVGLYGWLNRKIGE